MTRLILILALCLTASAQTLTVTGPATARPGQAVTLDLTLAGTPLPAGLQWTLPMPTGMTATAAAGPALGTVKGLHCTDNAATCLVAGMNASPVPAGVVARYVVQTGTVKGSHPTAFTFLLAANAIGDVMPLTSGTPYTLRILAISDINGDGVTSVADFNLIVDQVLGRRPCANDQNGDGKCDLLDVLSVVQGALNE